MKRYQAKYQLAGGSVKYAYCDTLGDAIKCFNEAKSGRMIISTVNN